ncbi:hypothetical protein [Pseudomonas syringae]|uniref:hypothetical protein n=1 Tax=Pseudomonas syringae TaxID=317 RepID=UPI003F7554AF
MRKVNKKQAEYLYFYLENILKFIGNRLFPYVSMTFVGVLIANKNIDEFAFFSYISSAFIFPATVATFMFMAIGNLEDKIGRSSVGEIFISSLVMAAISAGLVGGVCVFIIFLSRQELAALPSDYSGVSFTYFYLGYIMVYIFNSFLNCYFEAHVRSRISSYARLLNFLPLMVCSTYAFFSLSPENFSLIIIQFMLVFSVLELVFYCYMVKKLGLWKSEFQIELFRKLFKLGAPTGIGLALQRLAFFIVNKKLFLVDKDLVSIFSIAISIVSLMSIPVSAFTQIHSIYVTRKANIGLSLTPFLLLGVSMLGPLVVFLVLGNKLLLLFGLSDKILVANSYLTESITFMFLVTSSLMLVSSHVRALGTTLVPQIVINLSVYSIYVGCVFFGGIEGKAAWFLLSAYSVAYLICFFLLIFYVAHLENKKINVV